tara:strand:- start:162 stop:665 length:504 start_codon:yes stop_codon:yes gene_type:complete
MVKKADAHRNPNCQCKHCGKAIYRRPYQLETGNVFCSLKCCGKFNREHEVNCPICGKLFLSKLGKQITCSRSCGNKHGQKRRAEGASYNKFILGRALKAKIANARFLNKGKLPTCEKCANENWNILQVHHIIEKSQGGSNDLDNLMLLCPNCHAQEHLGYCKYQIKS